MTEDVGMDDESASDTAADQTTVAADTPPELGLGERWRWRMRWVFRRSLCFGGLPGALVFFALSLTPSLLPRDALFEGIVSGITAVIGYGVGSAVSS